MHHVIVDNRFSEENVLRDDIKLKDCLVVLVLVFAVDKALLLLVLKEVAVDKLFGVDVVSLWDLLLIVVAKNEHLFRVADWELLWQGVREVRDITVILVDELLVMVVEHDAGVDIYESMVVLRLDRDLIEVLVYFFEVWDSFLELLEIITRVVVQSEEFVRVVIFQLLEVHLNVGGVRSRPWKPSLSFFLFFLFGFMTMIDCPKEFPRLRFFSFSLHNYYNTSYGFLLSSPSCLIASWGKL